MTFILISGCQNENAQLKNDSTLIEEVNENENVEEEIGLLKEEVKNLVNTIEDLVIQNNELILSVSDMRKTVIELKNEIDKANKNFIPTVVQDEITPLSDNEIASIYQKAVKIYYWFEVGTLIGDIHNNIFVDNDRYSKMSGEITKYKELTDRMNSVLDYKIVKSLLSTNRYVNVNGDLYGILADRGTHMYRGEETYEIVRVNKTRIIYRVTVEVLDNKGNIDDYEIHDFHLKYYTDGK